MLIVTAIKWLLQMVGLCTVIWLAVISYQEYMKIMKENKNGQG